MHVNRCSNPGRQNVIKKETEKILKYKDLTIEIQRMWNVKTKVIPVIIGATGAISKSFRKHVSDISGTTEKRHIGHCTHSSESANVKEQTSQRRD